MKLFTGVIISFVISFAAQAQQLQFISGAVIKGRPYISAFEQGMDGSYFFSSQIDHVDGNSASSLTKTDQHGTIVTSFAGVETNDHILSIKELPDGKILIGGWFTEINSVKVGPVVRLNADGTIDESFTRWTEIPSYEYVSRFVVQSDGKIVVVGAFFNYLGSNYRDIVRLNQDGTVDETFALNVTGLPFVPFIEVDEGDNLAVSSGHKLYKLTPDGDIHPDFTPVEVGGTGYFPDFKFFKDGEILVGGTFDSFAGVPVNNIARVASDGTVDPSFNPGEFINYVWDLDVKDDDTFVAATHDGIKIFDDAGNPIQVPGLAAFNVVEMFLDDSQNLLLYGGFHQINGVEKPYLARLTDDFTFDQNFFTFFSYTTDIKKIAGQRDGKMLVMGGFYGINDTPAQLLRVNLNGSVDASFVAETSLQNLTSLAVRDDGKLLVTTNYSLKRLMPTGEIDNTFHEGIFAGATAPYLSSVKVHMNSIYVSGSFNSFDGHNSPGIVRLKMDGTVDVTFRSNLPPSTYISGFNFQSGNRIIATGVIPFAEGQKRLVRLAEDGLVDGTFFASNHTYNSILQIKADTKDNIYLAGDFTDFNGQAVSGLVKLTRDGIQDDVFQHPYSSSINLQFNAMELITDNRIVLGSSSPDIGLIVVDSTGQLVETDYASAQANSTFATSFFDGRSLFLGGRILTEDFQTVSGIAYVNFLKVDGTIEDLEVSRVNSTKIQLTWKNNFSNADAIIVERSVNDNASYSEIESLPPTAIQHEDVPVSEGNIYYYRLRAANSGSHGTYSNEAHVDNLVVGIGEETISRLAAYPNPAKGLLYIDDQNNFAARATILNALGKEVTTVEIVDGTIDVSRLAPAMYVLILNEGNTRNRQIRFVKE